jgi:hypothetical protein
MATEPVPENPPACEEPASDQPVEGQGRSLPDAVELSEFSQRLASFGLGEMPDTLLTEARRPPKRRSRN